MRISEMLKEKYRAASEWVKGTLGTTRGKAIAISGGCIIVAAIVCGVVISNLLAAAKTNHIVNSQTALRMGAADSAGSSAAVSAGDSEASSSSAASSSAASSSTASSSKTAAAPSPAAVSVSSVDFDHRSASIKVGATFQLKATISPSNATDKSLKWDSSNSNVATVDQNGLITGKTAGTAYVHAYATSGQRDTCMVMVGSSTGGSTGGTIGGSTGGSTGGTPTYSNSDPRYAPITQYNQYSYGRIANGNGSLSKGSFIKLDGVADGSSFCGSENPGTISVKADIKNHTIEVSVGVQDAAKYPGDTLNISLTCADGTVVNGAMCTVAADTQVVDRKYNLITYNSSSNGTWIKPETYAIKIWSQHVEVNAGSFRVDERGFLR